MSDFVVVLQRAIDVQQRLAADGIRSVIGGALALAYHVSEARSTQDVDLNVLLPKEEALRVLALLPEDVAWNDKHLEHIHRDGQVRIMWELESPPPMPLDLFFAEHEFHRVVTERALWVPMLDAEVPILSATDLTVFKALFDRPKDWVDIGEMVSYGAPSLDLYDAARWMREIVGDDPRVDRLLGLMT